MNTGISSVRLIDPGTLKQLLAGDLVEVLIDARSAELFNERHLPSALQVDWDSFCAPAPYDSSDELKQPGYWGKLAPPERLSQMIRNIGISKNSRVVVYGDGLLSKGREGRIAWMLLYLGLSEVSILDGGLRAWRRSGFETNSVPSAPTSIGSFKAVANEHRRCYLADVVNWSQDREQQNVVALMDTRSEGEYRGSKYQYQPRLGRIAGAVSFPYRRVLKASGEFISRDEYMNLIKAYRSINELTIWYCEVGVRAAMVSLLHELYTRQITRVYDGSFMEWSLQAHLPVERE